MLCTTTVQLGRLRLGPEQVPDTPDTGAKVETRHTKGCASEQRTSVLITAPSPPENYKPPPALTKPAELVGDETPAPPKPLH